MKHSDKSKRQPARARTATPKIAPKPVVAESPISELRYQRIFESAQDGILILDAKTGAITDVNPYLIEMLGYSRTEFLEKKLWEVGAFEEVEPSKADFRALLGIAYVRYEDLSLKAKDGRRIQVEFVSNLYRVGNDPVIQCNLRDITERKRVEAALEESERRYRGLFENASVGIFHSTPGGRFLRVNPALAAMLGYGSPEEMIVLITDINTQIYVDSKRRAELLTTTLNQEEWVYAENRYRRKDGSIMTANLAVRKVIYPNGTVAYLEGFVEDITKRKRAEEALRESEERFRALVEKSEDAIALADPDGTILYASPSAARIVGTTSANMVGHNTFDGIHPEDLERAKHMFNQVLQTPGSSVTSQFRLKHRDGSWRWVEGIGTNLVHESSVQAIVANYRDITERKRAEESLKKSDEQFQILANAAPVGIFRTDRQGQTVYVNPRWCEISKLTFEQALGDGWLSAVHPDDRTLLTTAWEKAISDRTGSQADYRFLRADGSIAWVVGQSIPQFDSSGEIVGYIGTIADITDRKLTEEKVRRSEAYFRMLIENGSDIITVTETDGTIRYESPSVETLLGYKPEELIGKSAFDLVHPDDLEKVLESFAQGIQNMGSSPRVEFRFHHKNGTWRILEGIGRIHIEESGQLIAVINSRDITERKRAEDALRDREQKYRQLFNSAEVGMFKTRLDGSEILDVNDKFLTIFSRTREEMQGNASVIHWADPHARAEMVRRLETDGHVLDFECKMLNKSGEVKTCLTSLHLYPEQGILEGSIIDITDRKRTEEEIQRRAEQLSTLNEIGKAVSEQLDLHNTLETIYHKVRRIIPLDAFYIALYDSEKNQLTYPLLYDEDKPYDEPPSAPKKGTLLRQTIETGQPLLFNHTVESYTAAQRNTMLGNENKVSASLLFAPLLHGTHTLGAMSVQSYTFNAYTEEHLALFSGIANQVAIAIENAQLYTSLNHEKRRLQLLYTLSQHLSASLDPQRISAAALKLLCSALDAFKGNIFVPLPGSDQMKLLAASGMSPAEIETFNRSEGLHKGRGITSWTSTLRSSAILPDVAEDEHWVNLPGLDDSVRSAISAPLIAGNELVGILNLLSDRLAAFHDAEKALVEAAAAPLAAALHNTRLFEETQQRARELETLAQVSSALRTVPTRAEMRPVILDQVLNLLHGEGAALALRDPVTEEIVIELGRGKWSSWTGIHLSPGAGVSGHVITTGLPYVTSDVRNDPRMTHLDLLGDLRAVASVPLVVRDLVIGAVWFGRRLEIKPDEVRLLTAIADIAANAIHRETLHEQTEQQLQRLAGLHTIDIVINASAELGTTLNVLLEQVIGLLKVSAAAILLFNPHTLMLEYAVGKGFRSRAIEKSRLRLGEGYAGRAALERRTFNVPDLRSVGAKYVRAKLLEGEEFVAYFGVPLVTKNKVIGVLDIFNRVPLSPDREWLDFMEAIASQAAIAIDNATLFNDLQHSNTEIALAYDKTIEGWSRALDLRDKETEGHTLRVTEMTLTFARTMKVNDVDLVHIRRGALLHDIGKMGVPDTILRKPGALDEEEWKIMRRHPEFAYELLSPIDYLRLAIDIPYCHHEKWDGTGYPRGLKGEAIPLNARIFALVDVWDALTSDRPYRPAWNPTLARAYIYDQAGKHFDPTLVPVFLSLLDQNAFHKAGAP
ncbi:MAG: PAS domain S-box protein [Chloroflexi bacterium]|nr:PAS domain S-box protein [Chloroflexota bacterium]